MADILLKILPAALIVFIPLIIWVIPVLINLVVFAYLFGVGRKTKP